MARDAHVIGGRSPKFRNDRDILSCSAGTRSLDGLEANRRPVDAFLRFAFEQGVVGRRMEVEELFAEETHSMFTL